MDIILKGKVTNANHDGSLWIKDWTKEPMPMYVFGSFSLSYVVEKFVLFI